MKELTINGQRLELYDSIDELPFYRFQEYNRAVMIDSGIGTGMEAADRHIEQALRFNALGKKEETQQAIMNLRQNLVFSLEKTSPEGRSFFVLISKINGKPLEDLSDENAAKVLQSLSRKGLTIGKLRGFLNHVKKNWMPNWKSFSLPFRTVRKQRNTTTA